MSTRLTCPGCGRQLLLPADCTAETLSCPRCLALLPNPQAADTSATVQTALSTATPAPTPTLAPAMEPVPDVDLIVRRDHRRISVLMIVLAVLGGCGISYALLGLTLMAKEGKDFQPLLIALCVLAAVTALSALWVFVRHPSRTVGANIGRTVLGVLSISGAVFAVGFLLVAACLIYLFASCLTGSGKC